MTVETPSVFMQMHLECKPDQKKTMMKLRGAVTEILVQCAPETNKACVVVENGQKVLCVMLLKASHGLLMSKSLFHKKLLKDLVSQGFESNPCGLCAMNKMANK